MHPVLLLWVLFWFPVAAMSASSADFKLKSYYGGESKPGLWALEITPSKGHHFNLEAPRSAQQDQLKFELVRESPNEILFQLENQKLKAGSIIEVSAFLCDQQKTYCMKKRTYVTLVPDQAQKISEKFTARAEPKLVHITSSETKQASVFIDQDLNRAVTEAQKSSKLLLVHFYGIWCPACNLYEETIFNLPDFRKESNRFVMLKMDADDERSWKLKSELKVGGYPTLVIARPDAQGKVEELERIVGYFPPQTFFRKLEDIYQHRNDSQETRWSGRLDQYLALALEQKGYEDVIQKTEKNQDPAIQVYRSKAMLEIKPDLKKDPSQLSKLLEPVSAISASLSKISSITLVHAADLLSDEVVLLRESSRTSVNLILNELEKRIDQKTGFVKDSELTMANLDSMRMEVAEILKDEKKVSDLRKKAIQDYETLINRLGDKGAREWRSMNLEYAYLLWKDGRESEAGKLYDQFIKKYPREFTFYFAASKMYLNLKNYPKARELAEKAYEYSYGDNRIRTLERLMQIMAEQGKKAEAVLRGNEFLKSFKIPDGLHVRTHRYLENLKKTIQSLQAENPSPTGVKS